MMTVMSTRPVSAEAVMSIFAQRSSRPGPLRPRTVSLRPNTRIPTARRTITPSANSPSPTSPPIANAPSISRPRNTENAGMYHRLR